MSFLLHRAAVVALAAPLAATLGMSLYSASGFAAVSAVDPDHLPMICDARLSVAELSAYKGPRAKKPYKVEISVPSLANPYITAVLYGAFEAAREAGVKVSVDSGEGFMDPAAQIRQVENALSRRFDALLINPADPSGLVATIDDIVAQGIPVIDVGTLSNSTKSYKVVQDDYAQGQTAAQVLLKLLPQGSVGIVQGGPANATWARRRTAGFSDAVRDSPTLKIGAVTHEDINPTEGLARFVNATQAHPKVDWIYSTFNLLLPPSSLPPEFRNAVYVGGAYDSVMIRALKDGTAKAALPDFPVAVGYIGMSYAVRKLNGEALPARNCIPGPAVTAENVNDPVWARLNLAPEGWRIPTH